MKKVWKWIIGILLGLVVLATLVGLGMAFRMHSVGYGFRGGDVDRFRGFGMMPFVGMHRGGPGMMGGFGMLFGGLVQLGLLAMLVFGIVWLVRKLGKPAAQVVPVAPVAPAAPTAVCGKCSYPVQNEWKVCPNCGKKL